MYIKRGSLLKRHSSSVEMERMRKRHDEADALGIESVWRLEDAKQKALEHAASFVRPPRQLLRQLRVGHGVKVCFAHDLNGKQQPNERLWLRVTSKLGGGRFRGTVANDVLLILGLNYGDEVVFCLDNVYDLRLDKLPLKRNMDIQTVCEKCSHPDCTDAHSPLPPDTYTTK